MGSGRSKIEHQILPKEETFNFPNKSLITTGHNVCLYSDIDSDKSFTFKTIREGYPNSFAEVFIDNKRFILILNALGTHYEIMYCDDKLNYIKTKKYPLHEIRICELLNVFLIDQDKFLVHTFYGLGLCEVGKPDIMLFQSQTNDWSFKVDSNKNLIICHSVKYTATQSFKIRTFNKTNLSGWTEKDYTVDADVPFKNLIYYYILPRHYMRRYLNSSKIILHVEIRNNKYYVITVTGRDVSLTELEDDDHFIKETVRFTCNHSVDYYKINTYLGKHVFLGGDGSDQIGCALSETYEEWYIRMLDLLKTVVIIQKFSTDVLKLVIEYVSYFNLSKKLNL